MKRTPQKLKRPRREPQPGLKLFKRKRRNLAPNFSFPRLRQIALPDLVVRPVLFLLLVVIFVPKVNTPETFSEAPICVFDVEKEVTGPVLAPPKIDSSRQDQNHDFSVFDQCEFDQGIEDPSGIQGKLRANFLFWRDVVRASEFVLDIIQNGYKILFRESPLPYSIENRSSALHQRSFVQGAISELLTRGCIRETPVYPQFCNPLHVAVQSSGKLRLILDLSHLNKFIVKKSVKYEDLRTVLQMFLPGMSVFSFDLKSAYHHIDICEEHRKFLSFKWPPSDGCMKFYEFKVLPFGLTSAPYVFTKVVRQLVKYWRGRGDLILMYLEDGIGGDMSVERSRILSDSVRHNLASSGFTLNDDKSIWEPTQRLVFLGSILDFGEGFIQIPEFRIHKLKSSLVSCLQSNQILARDLASVTGQIISMACAVGHITRLFTRNCYAAIECRSSWDQPLHVSPEVRYELSFWLNNIDSING